MKKRLSENSFLISIIINLLLLLVLSAVRENASITAKDDIEVDFVAIDKARVIQRRSIEHPYVLNSGQVQYNTEYVQPSRYVPNTKRILPQDNVTTAVNIGHRFRGNSQIILPSQPVSFSQNSFDPLSPSASEGKGFSGIGSSGRGTGRKGVEIKPGKPMASVTGSGRNVSGYYSISLVKYEDSSDSVSMDALIQLMGAMNRWTKIKTEMVRKPMMLDDPGLLRVPLIYITSRRAFAFSERERENLKNYFASGGFMIFSNTADSESESLGVAKSIRFELWKILGEAGRNLEGITKVSQVYGCFFDIDKKRLPDLLSLSFNGRISVIYEDSGYASAWLSGKDSDREPYLQMGVNIIAYALTTNPSVSGAY